MSDAKSRKILLEVEIETEGTPYENVSDQSLIADNVNFNGFPFKVIDKGKKATGCDCVDVEVGSYRNQIWVHPPAHMPKENGYCLDRCIAEEVMQLWMKGITTTGCCCGHNKSEGYIGVIDSDIPKMKEMGYEVHHNLNRPNDEDSFIPKSLINKDKA